MRLGRPILPLPSSNKMIGFCFPGQGSQQVGMGQAFYQASQTVRALYEEASDARGLDLQRVSWEGRKEELELTANAQPAILTASVAAATRLGEEGISPTLLAGHSLGEYSALVASGALAFKDAVRLVRRRGEFMQEAVPPGQGAMAAIIGVELPVVEEVCREAAQGEVVEVANVNAPIQVVIAGHKSAVERAVALVSERGGQRSVLLPVSAPFHCRLMAPAAERLRKELETVLVSPLKTPVVRNVDASVTTAPEDVKPLLVKQVASPVRWSDCVRRMAGEGVRHLVEVGPGRVLTGLLRRIVPDVTGYSVEDPSGLERTVAALLAPKGGTPPFRNRPDCSAGTRAVPR